MRKSRLDIMDWMIDCYNLSGLELFVYAVIYNEVEISIRKVAEIINMPYEEVQKIGWKLRDEGFIFSIRVTNEDFTDYNSTSEDMSNANKYLYVVNEDLLI